MTIHALIDRHLPEDSLGWRRITGNILRFIVIVGEHMDHDKVAIRASGLAYASLLAIVPLMAVIISVFSAIRAFENIEQRVRQFLVEQFVAARQAEVEQWIEHFTDGASRLGLLGFLLLIVTSILLLSAIETNFNQIWRVSRHRTWLSRVTSYTSVLVLGSIFVGASLMLSARLQTLLVTHGPLDPGIIAWFNAWAVPFLLSASAFLVAYLMVPHASVSFKSALIGATVSGVLFELGKLVFARTTGASVNLSVLYGSLAALPIFLIWLYYTWVIVLIGLEVAYTHQFRGAQSRPSLEERGLEGIHTSLSVYLAISAHFEYGDIPPTTNSLSRELSIPSDKTALALRRLADGNLVHRAQGNKSPKVFWVPTSPPDRTLMSHVIRVLGETQDTTDKNSPSTAIINDFIDAGLKPLDKTTVSSTIQGQSNPETQGQKPL
jgi:membrane protein